MNLDICKERSDHSEGFEYLYEKILEKSKVFIDHPFVEIGTREGGSALLFLHALKNTTNFLITIDPYGKHYQADGEWPPIGDKIYRTAQKLLADFCFENNTLHIPFRITSKHFMSLWDNSLIWINGMPCLKPFGVVYLDGEHTEETVLKEINWFLPRMHINGLLIIDDYSYLQNTENLELQNIIKFGTKHSNRVYLTVTELRKCMGIEI